MVDESKFAPMMLARQYQPPEKSALLPSLTDPYRAAGTANEDSSRLMLVMGKDGFKPGGQAYIALQYVHFGLGDFGFTATGQSFTFLVSDLQPKLLTVEGRNLLRVFDGISQRRMPWIRQTDRDFRPVDGDTDNEAVITRISLDDWTPPKD